VWITKSGEKSITKLSTRANKWTERDNFKIARINLNHARLNYIIIDWLDKVRKKYKQNNKYLRLVGYIVDVDEHIKTKRTKVESKNRI
jgi:hypothetical protein